jgi:predicted secreted protein
VTNLFAASVPSTDSEFASTSATAFTALALPEGEKNTTVVATVAGTKGSIAEKNTQDFTVTIIDANSLKALAMPDFPTTMPVNGEPFTPSFKGTYGDEAVTFNTAGAALSFKGATADDKTKYVEIISGAIYPRIAGAVTVVGTMSVTPAGEAEAKKITASADVQIVDAPLMGVTLASAEMTPTTTVNVDKTIRFKATADYGGTLTQNVTSAVVWVSSDPTLAIVSNASGTFGGPGKVTGVSPGGPVDIKAYYRSKLVGSVAVTVAP